MKESVHYQKNLLKYGVIAGLISTIVITIYTTASIRLQLLEMEKAQLDILIKKHKLESLRRELYPESSKKSEADLSKRQRSWTNWALSFLNSSTSK
ncbi:Oidioi.mRNA.OKI2018_I69.PAR.g12529.t1.cds [Oikopleura dioica]|uniref:Oidioi.mRNA.OKI2018_I69.PAR.g12529.t1.cds n=1 Tax=Oikopleura dioica TaxID=34765 RepID=A0ABN7S0D4_OIKDI|nr:Oidioi.mRNA.OKI2018_I69.PAR.g12529.t1.cds [Oikopleura dioica]